MPRSSTDTDEIVYRKARPDLYTVLLAISLLAILFGAVLLYLHMQGYEFKLDGAPTVSWRAAPGGIVASLADAAARFLT